MPVVARGQITIVDLNDGRPLSLFLGTELPLTQTYLQENNTYVPDWRTKNMVITPQLFVTGVDSSQMSQVKSAPVWKINGSTNLAEFGASVANKQPYALTINKNMGDNNQLLIECEVSYTDPVTTLVSKAKASISLSKNEDHGRPIFAVGYTPKGNVFKQGINSLTAHCDLWRGANIDNTNVSYTWYKLNFTSGNWEKLTQSSNYGITGFTTNEITIPSSAVLNSASFKCVCRDEDTNSGTYTKEVAEVLSFVDNTDPFKLDILAPQGTTMVAGQESTTLNAQVWQGGELLTGAKLSSFKYNWLVYDKNGTTKLHEQLNSSSPTFTLLKNMVNIKAVVICELVVP